jgi:hypothetical protein
MTDLYLIAHKVRGEPAFDIARRACASPPCQPNCGRWKAGHCADHDEEVWIIPTSGHRAYPYFYVELSKLKMYFHSQDGQWTDRFDLFLGKMPTDLEDHYTIRADPSTPRPAPSGLLALLGLGKPKPTIARRL